MTAQLDPDASKRRPWARTMVAVARIAAVFALSAAAVVLVVVFGCLTLTPSIGILGGIASEFLP